MAGGKRGCLFGLILGSILKLFMGLMKGVVYAISWSILYLGLWAPMLYALVGLILYLTVHFNPFDWTALGQLYFAGFVATVVLALIITIRNLVIKPLKSVSDGYKNPVWKRKAEKSEPDTSPTVKGGKAGRKLATEPVGKLRASEEEPMVYESNLEKGSIIHEYEDRFEVYVLKNGRLVLDKVEMKNEEY